jgi:acylphosphatase
VKTVRPRVTGRVHRVGYRAWAERVATDLGLRGWVRNRADGSVEMLITGADDCIASMLEAARRGPPAARVDNVQVEDDTDDGSPGFAARPTA